MVVFAGFFGLIGCIILTIFIVYLITAKKETLSTIKSYEIRRNLTLYASISFAIRGVF